MKPLRAIALIAALVLTAANLIGVTGAAAQGAAPADATARQNMESASRFGVTDPQTFDIASELQRRLDYQRPAPETKPLRVASTVTSVVSGPWSNPATWGGSVPGPTDDVVIGDATLVTIDTTPITVASLTVGQGVSGILQYDATARALTVTGSVMVNPGGFLQTNLVGVQTGHSLSVGANLTNNGSLDLSTSANTSGATLTFTGAASNTFSGTGATTDIRTLAINKTAVANILEVSTSAFTVQGASVGVGGFVVMSAGTLKWSGAFSLSTAMFTSAAYVIPSTGGLWLNNPNLTITGQNGSPAVNGIGAAGTGTPGSAGLLRISAGTLNIGTATGNSMGFGNNTTVIVEGGAVNATGRFGVAAAGNNVNYTQTGGTITVCTVGNASAALASFDLGTGVGADPIIQGGTIIIRLANTSATIRDYRNEQGNTGNGIIGGTVQFGDAGSGAAKAFQANGIFPDVVITNTTGNHSVTLRAPSFFFNNTRNVTINTGNTLNLGVGANNLLFISGSSTFTNNGTLVSNSAGNRFVYFTAGANGVYAGTGVSTGVLTSFESQAGSITMNQVNNLVVRRIIIFSGNILNSGKLTLGDGTATLNVVQIGNTTTPTAAGTFDAAPVFNLGTGGQQVSYLRTTAARSTGPEINPTRSLINFTQDDNAVGPDHPLTLSGGDVAATSNLNLTNGRIVTGASKVIGNGLMSVAGGWVDGNLQRPVPGAGSQLWQVGTSNGASPVSINFASVASGGNLTVAATAPSVPPPASGVSMTKYVNRSWTLTNGGITSPSYAATFNWVNGDLVGGATAANLKFAKNTSGTWSYPAVGAFTATSVTTAAGQTTFSDFYLAECPIITVNITKTDISCFGANDGTATASASGGAAPYTYSWAPGGPGASLTNLGPGSYTVTATDANGCTGVNSVTIIEPAQLVVTATPDSPTVCTGGTTNVTVSATGGTTPYSGTGVFAQGAGTTTYTVTDANGCMASQDVTITVTQYTITASAGANGAIFPNGPVTVACGTDQSFTITPDPGYVIDDVLVDAVSQGPIPNYMFTNVMADHSISATFKVAGANTVTPGNPAACITPGQPCQTVPVDISRTDTTPMRLFHVEFQLSPELQLCGTPSASITEGTYLSSFNPSTTFFVTNNGGGSYTADGTINGAPCGQAAASGNLFNIAVTHTGSSGTGTVTVTLVTLRDCSNVAITPTTIGPAASVTIDLTPVIVAAITDPQTVEEQSSLTVTPSATQSACAPGTLVWSVSPPLPAGASFNTGTGEIMWTPACGDAGPYGPFTLKATAPSGDFGTSNAFAINVTHKIGTVAVGPITDPQPVAEGTLLIITPTPTVTPCAASPLTWSVAPPLPAGATFSTSNGEIQWTPDCAAAEAVANGDYGPFTLTAVAATGETGYSNAFTIHVINTPVAIGPPTGVAASQVLTGNPPGQTTGITVNFTSPGGAAAILVYRAPFGNYPEYDDAGGATPVQPTTWPPAAPWTLTAVTTSGGVDSPGTRDFWYYVAYAQSACGDYSMASTMTGGTLDYHLGDVSDGVTPGTGDNLVLGVDVSALGGYYGMELNPSDPYNYLDVGPTTTNYVDGRPTTDNKVNFEDLVMFAINYSVVSAPNIAEARPADGTSLAAAASDRLVIHPPTSVTAGQTLQIPIVMEGTGSVQAMSIQLGWDPTVVRPVSHQAGALLYALDGLALSATPGTVDVAGLGHDHGLVGSGELALVAFEVIGTGDPAIRIETVDARDARNQAITVNSSREVPLPDLPQVTALQMTSGNPSRQSVAFAVSLAQPGNVDLSIYAVDGRRVAVLMSGMREPGVSQLTWDGRDDRGRAMSSGVFYVRLTAGSQVFKRTVMYLR